MTHFRRVVQALKFFTGIDKVCKPESRWRELGKGHGKVYTGVFLYDKPEKKKTKKKSKETIKPERIMYWWKDPVDEFQRNICYY